MKSIESSKYLEDLDYEKIRDDYCNELSRSAKGQTTSLPFIHNALPNSSLVRPEENFQAFVIGGTNGEVATVKYDADSTVSVVSHEAHPEMTKFKTVEDFLNFIDSHVEDDTKAIGISLAAELIPVIGSHGQLDGILNEGETKGHGFHGLQQEQVGVIIEQHFRRTHNRELIVSVGNDTVTLIAAMAGRSVDRNTLLAGIVGTGYNMSFFLDDRTIINVQSSDFASFTPSLTGKVVDLHSTNPGKQLFDKEVAKLSDHYNALVDMQDFKGGYIRSTQELAELAITNGSQEGESAKALFQRSSWLVAAQLAGFYNFKGRPTKLTAVMQGSLFWEGPKYKEMVDEELLRLDVPVGTIDFVKLNMADIIGAAKLITGGV